MKPIEKRLIVVGGRYVGKTSMINALAKHAPETWQKLVGSIRTEKLTVIYL